MKPQYGMIRHQSVYESLKSLVESFGNIVAVVRSLDSSREGNDLQKILDFHRVPYKLVQGNVCLFEAELKQALNSNVFTGFDEIWLFFDDAPQEDLSEIPYCTSDSSNFDEKINDKILMTFQEIGCVAILADGCGLNFLTDNDDFYNKIRQ